MPRLGQLLHLPGGYALHKGLLNDLNAPSFTALARWDKERDITALPYLRNHEVHRPHTCVQTARTVAAAIAAPSVRALTFLCSQLLVHLGLHELGALLFQHTQHRIRLRHALQQQFCQIDGILFVSH